MRIGIAGKVYLASLTILTLSGFAYYVRVYYPLVPQVYKDEAGVLGFVAYFVVSLIVASILSVFPWWISKVWLGLKGKNKSKEPPSTAS